MVLGSPGMVVAGWAQAWPGMQSDATVDFGGWQCGRPIRPAHACRPYGQAGSTLAGGQGGALGHHHQRSIREADVGGGETWKALMGGVSHPCQIADMQRRWAARLLCV